MKKVLYTFVIGSLVYSVSLSAQEFSFGDYSYEAAVDEAVFQGQFSMCISAGAYLQDDAQCRCIFKVLRENLSEEDFKKAQQLQKEGRTGSAEKIYKKALPVAFKNCF